MCVGPALQFIDLYKDLRPSNDGHADCDPTHAIRLQRKKSASGIQLLIHSLGDAQQRGLVDFAG
jgi:hypothetical protein